MPHFASEDGNRHSATHSQQSWRSGTGGRFTVDSGGGGSGLSSPLPISSSGVPYSGQPPQPGLQHASPYQLSMLQGASHYPSTPNQWELMPGHPAYSNVALSTAHQVYQQQMASWMVLQQQQQQMQAAAVPSHTEGAHVKGAHPAHSPRSISDREAPQQDFRKKALTHTGNLVSAFSAMPPFQPPFSASGHATPQASKQPLIDPANLSLPVSHTNGYATSLAKPHRSTPAASTSQPVDAPSPVQDLNFRAMSRDVEEYQSSLSRQINAELDKATTGPRKETTKKVSIAAQAIPMPSRTATDAIKDRLARSPLSVSPLAAAASASTSGFLGETAEELEANDPLATQMWKFFSKAKGSLPHSTRMENLSWRMGGMKLSQVVAERPIDEIGSKQQDKGKARVTISEEEELERRGRKTKSASHTPEYSGSSGPSDMDWKSQSRSRSRPPTADMDWRQASRSRSRVRPRLSLPILNDEAPPSSALHDSLPSIEQDLYAQIFGNGAFDPLPPASAADASSSALDSKSQKEAPHESFGEWFGQAFEQDIIDLNWAKPMPVAGSPTASPTGKEAALKSFNMDPLQSIRQNASVPGLLSEQSAPENQNLDFGFIPKLVRKTSADAVFGSSMPQPASAKKAPMPGAIPMPTTRPTVNAGSGSTTPASIDLAALGRPAPSTGVSPSVSPGGSNLYHLGNVKEAPSAYSQAFKNMAPMQTTSPVVATPYGFASLPNSPVMASAGGGYFGFASYHSPASLAASTFVDPSVLVGPSPNSSQTAARLQSQLAAIQGMTALSPHDELPWAFSPDALSDLHSQPNTPLLLSRNNSFADLGGLNMQELSASQQFEGGPKRSASTKRKVEPSHSRAQSVSGVPGSEGGGGSGGRAPADTTLVCSNCKTSNTPLWRRDEAGKPLCNGCGLFKKLHGIDRPLSLATGIVKKRNRSKMKDRDGDKKKATGTARTASRKNSTSVPKASTGGT